MEKIASLAVCLAPLIYFLPATLGRIVLCPDDGWAFYLPMRVAAAHIAHGGEFPLWNPYMFGGMPLFGAIQGGVLFPPNWVFLVFSPQPAMNLTMLFAYMFAGLGTYCFARRTGMNIAGAFIAGFIWQVCGFLIAPMGHMTSIQAASLLPWLLWSIDGYGMTGRRSRAVLIALFIALQIFAGHPQTFVYSSCLVGIYALVMAFMRRPSGRVYLYSMVMMIAGITLAAVQLIPTAELSQYSFRHEISYEFFSSFSMPPSFLLNFLAPFVTGGGDGRFFQMPYVGENFYGEYIGYVGVTTLMLALVAPLIKRDTQTVFWSIVVLACLALALGRFLPFDLYRLIFYIPVLNLFCVSARHLMEVDFALAVLAGRGLTALSSLQARAHTKKLIAVGAGVLILTLLTVLDWRHQFLTPQSARSFQTWRIPEVWCPIALAVIGAFTLWMLARGYRNAVALAIIVIVCDASLWGQFSGWRSSPPRDGALWGKIPVMDFLRQRQRDEEPFKVLSLTPPPDPNVSGAVTQLQTEATLVALLPNSYMAYGIQNVAGCDAFGVARFSRFADDMKEWGELIRPSQSLTNGSEFDLLDVRYLIAKRTPDGEILTANHTLDEKSLAEHWQHVAQFDDAAVYQNTRSLPRAWLTTEALTLLREDDALNIIHTGKIADGNSWDARRTVLLSAPLDANLTNENSDTHAVVTNYTANRVDVETDCAAAAVLVLAENFYPGWHVKIDGREQEVLRVNYNLRGVSLSSGRHDVEFSYRPKSFLSGATISIAALVVLLLWWRWGGKTHDITVKKALLNQST
ncbi:MAG: YfhO family protein [Pyrinomonadaceae bacterium]